MPFGVELPANLGESTQSAAAPSSGSESSSSSPEGSSPRGNVDPVSGTEISTKSPQSLVSTPKELTDLDKLERFRFEGREWTRKDLRNAYLRHEDYTRKTQELAETRKYADNFAIDFKTVQKDPSRFEEFAKLYPREYVERVRDILGEKLQSQRQENPQSTSPQNNPVYERRIEALESQLKGRVQQEQQQEIEKIQSWLNNTFESLSKKYPDARMKEVNADAEVLANQGTKITADVLEKLFKASDSEIRGAWQKRQQDTVKKQINVGSAARDVGPGGGVPSEGPKNFKTIKEATNAFLQDIGRSRQ